MELLLASTSPYRKALLDRAGIPVATCKPDVDESLTKKQISDPQVLAETLAQLKATSGKELTGAEWVIGSDQVACFGKLIFDKPGTRGNAQKTLKILQGRSHKLITSVHLITPSKSLTWSNITTLHMRELSERDIDIYLDTDEPWDCAGSYKLECAGIRLFEKIESTDFTAIQGLPMIELCNQLLKFGYRWI